MKPLFIEAVGLAAPGLENWSQGAAVLRGERAYERRELETYQPNLLPPNERRRATAAVRLAFRAAEDAMSASRYAPAALATVFASSDADTHVIHRICTALAQDGRVVSPTDFHNSVHNAAAGYWSIAAGSRQPSASLSAWDWSFAAGLLEAAGLVHADGLDVLLVAYDIRPPEPLYATRPTREAAGVALVLSGQRGERSRAQLQLTMGGGDETMLDDTALEDLRRCSPAARALPLLRLLALGAAGDVVLQGAGSGRLRLSLRPC